MIDLCFHYEDIHSQYGRFFFDLVTDMARTWRVGRVYIISASQPEFLPGSGPFMWLTDIRKLPAGKRRAWFETAQFWKEHKQSFFYGPFPDDSIYIFGSDKPGVPSQTLPRRGDPCFAIATPSGHALWSVMAAGVALKGVVD